MPRTNIYKTQHLISSIAFITTQAFSLKNFRGPLIRELVSKGIECYALAPDFDDRIREEISALGAEPVDIVMRRASIHPLRDAFDMFSLIKVLRAIRPDAVLAYFIKPVIFGTLAARLANVPRRFCIIEGAGYVFVEDDNGLTTGRRLLRYCVSRLYKLSLGSADKIFLLNPDDFHLFTNKLKIVDTGKAIMIPGIGIDLEAYPERPSVTSPITFILLARMLAEKGVREFAVAAYNLKKRYPETQFLLVGNVDENPGSLTSDEINDWVRDGFIKWIGQVDDVRPWIASSSVMVLPSYYREGLPRSLMEGMAMGRPIITTDMPGCRETVVEGQNGYLVPARNHVSLVDAMENFIENPDIIKTMGKQSRLIAENRFDIRKINNLILQYIGVL